MDWIKKNYDQFALGLFSLALLLAAGVIYLKTRSFNEGFVAIQSMGPQKDKLPPIEKGPVEAAVQKLTRPAAWSLDDKNRSLFVAKRFLIDSKTGRPRPPGGGDSGEIPEKWLMKYNLNILSDSVQQEDPDKDGFTNLEEYLGADRVAEGNDSTDPNNPNSHPPYYTKLFLKQYIKVPFRLRFEAYDGDPKTVKAEAMSYQINTLDLRQPTEFLKLGETVKNTKYKLMKFVPKGQLNPTTNIDQDVSELTLLNTETDESVVLVIGRITDSPDSFALFSYTVPLPAQDIRVKKLGEFVLRPNIQEKYKLIDIQTNGAQIALPSGDKYAVPQLAK